MTRSEIMLLMTQKVTVAISDPHLSQIKVKVGNCVHYLDTGYIPLYVRIHCEAKPDEAEMV